MKKVVHVLLYIACSLCATAQPNVPLFVPTPGLQAWYSFKGNAGDSSGIGNHGVNYGATLTTDRFGVANAAYYFNGTSNYIYIAPSSTLNLPKEVSIMACFKPATLSGTMQLFWRGDTRSAYDPYMLYFPGSGNVYMRRDVGSFSTTTETGFTTSSLDTSHFFMMVGTYTPSDDSMRIYLNGRKVNSRYLPGSIAYSTSGFWNVIGAVNNGGQYFKGVIDDVGAWNRKLHDCEIEPMYLGLNTLITLQPRDTTARSGDSAVFVIRDTGMVSTYRWQVDDGSGYHDLPATSPYYGVNTRRLVIRPVSYRMNGYRYRCIHDAVVCTDSSYGARLTAIGDDSGGGTDTTLSVAPSFDSRVASVYPNPTKGTLTLNNLQAFAPDGQLQLEVRDLAGRIVYSQSFREASNTEVFTISVSAGTYLLRISGSAKAEVVKIEVVR